MSNTNDDSHKKDLNFYLDPLLIDLNIVKRIGIEKDTNSIIVEAHNHIILQTIDRLSFSNNTAKPIKKQLEEVLIGFQKEEKKKIANSIITCINRNTDKVSKYCKEYCSSEPSDFSEEGIVDSLVKLALNPENTKSLFIDQNEKPHAAVMVGTDRHLEIFPVYSSKFKRYLSKLYRSNFGSCISDSSLNTVITNLAAEAEFNGEVIPLHLRVAWGSDVNRCNGDCIYYDMSDVQRKIIEISIDGWKIIDRKNDSAPILFRKYNQQPLVEPSRNYPANIFDQFLNLTNVKNPKHRQLIKVYIISTLIPEIDHIILTTYGPKGAAKSFLLELIKKMIDPTKPTLLTLHGNIDQFIQQVNHNYLNYYDNVKFIPYWLSDEICKAVTGIGHTKRQLFTDDDDIIYEHKRCLGLNGINVALTESDALDRSLFVELEEIDEEKRRKEEDLWKEFERIKPQVLGYILDVLVKAMQIKQTLHLQKLPRMADFAEWSEAISQALGYPPMSFIEVYAENRNEINIIAVNESAVGSLVVKYILDHEKQFGLITKVEFDTQELYKTLIEFAGSNEIDIRGREFPKNAGSLVRKINTIIPNLKSVYGIIIKVGRNTDTNTSTISISRKNKKLDIDNIFSGGSELSEAKNTISYDDKNKEDFDSEIHDNVDLDDSTSFENPDNDKSEK